MLSTANSFCLGAFLDATDAFSDASLLNNCLTLYLVK